jgi:O-methyltransferase/methyltransferase family protein
MTLTLDPSSQAQQTMNQPPPITPDHIMQLGSGFWASKTLLSAVELGLFSELANAPVDAETLRARLGLNGRGAFDFFNALVALGLLERTDGRYANTLASDLFLDRAKPTYLGGILEMFNARLYGFWGSLTEALRTGQPQNEVKTGGNFFATLYADPQSLRQFMHAMTGLSLGAAQAIARQFPWQRYQTFVDLGAAEGGLPVQLVLAHPHLTGTGFDLPPVRPIFEDYVASFGLADRLQFRAGDFFNDPLPRADVIVMGHVLHDWSLEEKRQLIARAYAALTPGGAIVLYESIIDDERRTNVFGLLMSLNMLIETSAGFDYTGAQCSSWLRDAGFRETYVEHLVGPDAMVVGVK